MFLDINEIREETVRVECRFTSADLPGAAEAGTDLVFATLLGEAGPGPNGPELAADLCYRVVLPCSRCLEPFESDLSTQVRLTLVGESSESGPADARLDPQDAALFYASGDKVDVRAIVLEQVVLGLPLKPLCRATCRGLCPGCGANRNDIECGCQPEEPDARLAALLDLKRRLGGG
jgi:uncharacterized protein